MDGFDRYWLLMTLILFLAFLPVEIWAIRDGKPGGTLSESVWSLLYPKPDAAHYRYRRWLRLGLLVGFGWLVIHFFTRGWI